MKKRQEKEKNYYTVKESTIHDLRIKMSSKYSQRSKDVKAKRDERINLWYETAIILFIENERKGFLRLIRG